MELSIQELAEVLYKRIKFILLLTLLGACTFFIWNRYVREPVYTASVQLYVNSYGTNSNETLNDLNYAQKIVNTYVNFLRTKDFYRQVKNETNLHYTTTQLENMTQIVTVNDTEIFEISVTSNNQSDTYKLVKAMETIAPKLIGSIKDNTRISIVDPVVYPEKPSGPAVFFNTAIGGVFGFALAFVLAFLQKMMDVKVKNTEELSDRYLLPILGTIPGFDQTSEKGKRRVLRLFSKKKNKKERNDHVIKPDTNFVITEAYKALRTNLRYILREQGCKTLLVNSPTPADGKSTTCGNTAITIAQTGARVLLIDCDLRKGRLHKAFGLNNTYGISDLISGVKIEKEVIQDSGYENLHIITLGTIPPNPTELLSSVQMEEVMLSLKRYYDYILLDSPPVNVVSDALSLSKMVDGVVLVVKENETTHPNIATAISKYALVDGKILGFVLNGVSLSQGMKSKYSYYYYDNSKH